MNRSVLIDMLSAGALACVVAGATLGDPVPHSEQGEFTHIVVFADDAVAWCTSLDEAICTADLYDDVVYAGPFPGERESWAYSWWTFHGSRHRLTCGTIAAAAEG